MSGRRDRSYDRGGDRERGDRGGDRGGSGRGGRYPPRDHDSYPARRRGSRSRSPRRDGRDRDGHRDRDWPGRERGGDKRDHKDRDRPEYRRDRSPDRRDDRRRRDERDGERDKDRNRERERGHDRERDREHARDSAPPPGASSTSHAHRTDTPASGTPGPSVGSPSHEGAPEEGEEMEEVTNDDDSAMMAMMGLSGFGTTKGKHVLGNQEGGANVKKVRTWRQYMNRRGGFNRPLDKIK